VGKFSKSKVGGEADQGRPRNQRRHSSSTKAATEIQSRKEKSWEKLETGPAGGDRGDVEGKGWARREKWKEDISERKPSSRGRERPAGWPEGEKDATNLRRGIKLRVKGGSGERGK